MLISRTGNLTHIFSRRICTFAILVTTLLTIKLPGIAEEIPNQALADLITQQKILPSGQSVKAVVDQFQATVTTELRAKDSDDATKLRAVLIAKCVFDSQPASVQKAVIVFLDYATNAVDTVTIKRAEVTAFGEGKLDEKALLATIDFDKKGVEKEQSAVVKGDMQAQREMLLDRITRMKSKGTNVSAFMNIFSEIETLAQSDDKSKLKERIEYLSEKVSEQESALKAAQIRQRSSNTSSHVATSASANSSSASGLTPDLARALDDANMPQAKDPIGQMRMILIFLKDNPTLNSLDSAVMSKNRAAIEKVMRDYANSHH